MHSRYLPKQSLWDPGPPHPHSLAQPSLLCVPRSLPADDLTACCLCGTVMLCRPEVRSRRRHRQAQRCGDDLGSRKRPLKFAQGRTHQRAHVSEPSLWSGLDCGCVRGPSMLPAHSRSVRFPGRGIREALKQPKASIQLMINRGRLQFGPFRNDVQNALIFLSSNAHTKVFPLGNGRGWGVGTGRLRGMCGLSRSPRGDGLMPAVTRTSASTLSTGCTPVPPSPIFAAVRLFNFSHVSV